VALRFEETIGGAGDDMFRVTEGEIALGLGGDDRFETRPGNDFVIAMGGPGNDVYVAEDNAVITVGDTGGASDTLVADGIGFSWTTSFAATLNGGRHLVAGDTATGQTVYVLNWRDPAFRIETIDLADIEVGFQELASVIEGRPNFLGDLAWREVSPENPTSAQVAEALSFYQDREAMLLAGDGGGNDGGDAGDSGAGLDFAGLPAASQIAAIYAGYFGRAPDPEGLSFWVAQHQDGLAAGREEGAVVEDIAESFRLSQETAELYPFLAGDAAGGASRAEIAGFVADVFMNLFERAPDPAGQAFWVDQIAGRLAEGIDLGDIIVDIVAGAQGGDATLAANKIAVGEAYAETFAEAGVGWTPATHLASAREVVDRMTVDNRRVGAGEVENLLASEIPELVGVGPTPRAIEAGEL